MSEIRTIVHPDYAERKFTIERVQDVEAIIERNKVMQTIEQKSDWGRKVAEIPNIFIEKWLNDEWQRGNVDLRVFTPEFDELCDRKLKDPEFRDLRTHCPSVMMGFGS